MHFKLSMVFLEGALIHLTLFFFRWMSVCLTNCKYESGERC